MKKLKLKFFPVLFAMAGLTVANVNAADLCVAENGTGGCYSTIQAAVNAAANGDRILIYPKSGGAAYVENVSITKSLQFLSAVEAQQYVTQGNYTITPAIGRTVTFIGMKNLQGSILTTTASPAGARCAVNVMNCTLEAGNINFNFDYFNVTVASSIINGYVEFRYGKAIGNEINSGALPNNTIYVTSDAIATNDTIWIVGNKITRDYGGYLAGINISTTNQFFYIANNYVQLNNLYMYGIITYYGKTSNLISNIITNNTVYSTGGISGIYVYVSTVGSIINVNNNLILATSGVGLTGSSNSGLVGASYNFMNSPLSFTGIVDDGTNNITSNSTLDIDGNLMPGSDGINGGNPDSVYYDLDLTVNDVGAYGGSFTLTNFHPVTGPARVFFVRTPRRVTVGSTFNVNAESFDR